MGRQMDPKEVTGDDRHELCATMAVRFGSVARGSHRQAGAVSQYNTCSTAAAWANRSSVKVYKPRANRLHWRYKAAHSRRLQAPRTLALIHRLAQALADRLTVPCPAQVPHGFPNSRDEILANRVREDVVGFGGGLTPRLASALCLTWAHGPAFAALAVHRSASDHTDLI